ncbi:SMI1/KNR4 family protein [Paenibacillus sp. MMS18-CY102]|uniref:SMI1/KNR4 family protein n=1 Tax=Paenibacillus sp. MMS18-CY102 TaxID=2682849 RepID=UPI001366671F|nr:SMI1/KNR4 family protein [Paenibacillus sp. MMS18-CY102]MWC30013.1 SMI1/KNR4 family protein [Paenibacillus sp. MMS18-CY102]
MEKLFSNNEDLLPFVQEINRYAEGVHSLNEGIDESSIEDLESMLKVKFPKVYKDFLQICNGGELFIPGTVISEIYTTTSGPKQRGGSYLNDSFMIERRRPGMPDTYLIIADLNYGDTICLDLDTNNGYESTVVQWDREAQEVSRSWGSFVEWIMDTLEEGAMLVDYEGNEKDLDF